MSSCNTGSGLTPITISQGSDVTFLVKLLTSDQANCDPSSASPTDLTQCTACSVKFLNADKTYLTVDLTSGLSIVSPSTIGRVSITLTAAQTKLLMDGVNSFEMTAVINGATKVIPFQSGVTILESVFD